MVGLNQWKNYIINYSRRCEVVMNGEDTGYLSDVGTRIFVGDILYCKDGYYVLVCKDNNNHYYGSLVCKLGHSCRSIPYSLDEGHNHLRVAPYIDSGGIH
jgi:hypothetical protein